MSEIKLNTIEEAIEDFRDGKFLIVVDDEDRENEGDFIVAAEKITPEKVNFMLTYGRGVLCAPITEERCRELDLEMQVSNNTSILETPFTVTVDKLGGGCTTGVSMYDRAQTILALADPNTKPSDLWQTRTYQSPAGTFAWCIAPFRTYRSCRRPGSPCRFVSCRSTDRNH